MDSAARRSRTGVALRFRIECELSLELAQQTPLIAIFDVNVGRAADLRLLDHWTPPSQTDFELPTT
jgi:hypothetical protein